MFFQSKEGAADEGCRPSLTSVLRSRRRSLDGFAHIPLQTFLCGGINPSGAEDLVVGIAGIAAVVSSFSHSAPIGTFFFCLMPQAILDLKSLVQWAPAPAGGTGLLARNGAAGRQTTLGSAVRR